MKVFRGIEPSEAQVEKFHSILKVLDTLIGDKKHFVGNAVTIADLSVLATITPQALQDYKPLDECPHLKKWFHSIKKELPYFDEVNGGVDEGFVALVKK